MIITYHIFFTIKNETGSGGRGGGWHQRNNQNWSPGGNGGGQANNWNQGGNGGGQATNQMEFKLGAATSAPGDNGMATQQTGVKLGAVEPATLFGNNQNIPRGGTSTYQHGGGSPGERKVKFVCYNCIIIKTVIIMIIINIRVVIITVVKMTRGS